MGLFSRKPIVTLMIIPVIFFGKSVRKKEEGIPGSM